MMPIRRVAATLMIVGLTCSVGACSSSDDDAPPGTDVVGSAVVVDPDATITSDAVTTDAVTTGSETVPATGIGSIDGPATVDPEYGGANPGGADTGG
jgi:hypothetical protein